MPRLWILESMQDIHRSQRINTFVKVQGLVASSFPLALKNGKDGMTQRGPRVLRYLGYNSSILLCGCHRWSTYLLNHYRSINLRTSQTDPCLSNADAMQNSKKETSLHCTVVPPVTPYRFGRHSTQT